MTGPSQKTHRVPRFADGGLITVTLAMALLLGACDRSQPVAPERAAPDRPSLTVNPACGQLYVDGTMHTDTVLAPETWTRAGNPHQVYELTIKGAGVVTMEPGVLVCLGSGAIYAVDGGRLVANGLDTARIVLTARDPYWGWYGLHLMGSPTSASSLRHVRIEHTSGSYALSTHHSHAVHVDSSVFRQTTSAMYLTGHGSHVSRTVVDTTTAVGYPAVTLGTLVTWEQNVIRGAADVGLAVRGTYGVSLLGGRIEGSGGVGLQVTTTGAGFVDTDPVRVVGGATYPAELVVSAFPRIYPAPADQDSLLGNARDTVVVTGGILQQWAQPAPALPWRVTGDIVVQHYGILLPKPGASLAFVGGARITARDGGRVLARGTAAAPVRFTRATPSEEWFGIDLYGAPSLGSYLTNVRLEGAIIAARASGQHPLVIDSAVIRQSWTAAWLYSAGSRISRSRVDTTLAGEHAAVQLFTGTTLESTRIRGAAGTGVLVMSGTAQVLSCDIRDSAGHGIVFWESGAVHDCNLSNNGGSGILADYLSVVDAENNWWGDSAGPTGTNGDGVSGSGSVDYTPWRTTPYTLPYVP